MSIKRSLVPEREWVYADDGKLRQGVRLSPEGITYWGEAQDDEDSGAYLQSFADFLRNKRPTDALPEAIRAEIREILEAARR